jgi:hypothetical protein
VEEREEEKEEEEEKEHEGKEKIEGREHTLLIAFACDSESSSPMFTRLWVFHGL